MQKVKDSDLTLYEEIEEIKKRRARQKEQGVSCPSCVSCNALTLCNNSDNYKTHYKTDTSQGRLVHVSINDQEPTPNQDPCPVPDVDLTAMYTVKLEAIAKIYYESNGDYAWLKENNPDAYGIINESEDKLNKIWLQCLDGKSIIQDFEQALSAWYRACIQGIKLSVGKQVESREQQLALW